MINQEQTGIRFDRLKRLADFAETEIPPGQLFMATWWDEEGLRWERAGCKTAACVWAWACTIPEFKEAGLTLLRRDTHEGGAVPRFKGEEGFEAASAFFGVSFLDATKLLAPTSIGMSPDHPTEIAARIRAFIVSKGGTV